MKRHCLVVAAGLLCPVLAGAGNSPDIKTTIAYVHKLQTPSGAFLPQQPLPGSPQPSPSLRATSAAVRTLGYLGGTVPNKAACSKFVAGCFDKASGGFADSPGGTPNVFTTAIGLMAVVELKMPLEDFREGAVKFLADNSKSFDDIRIAVAGLEAVKEPSPRAAAWLAQIRKMQNADGTYGKDLGQARDTGSAVVAVLRLGGDVPERDRVLKVLKAGQRLNGGFGKADSELASDLDTTYRVMRAFVMLKERPDDVEGVRSFIAKCRNEDGGYGVAPGQPSSVSGAYYAAIIRRWLDKK
jgi:hypothetical protein